MDPVSCRMHLESLLTIGLYIRQDAFQLWLRFLFRPVLFLYLYNVTPQTFALIQKYLKEKIESFTSEETNQFEERLENLLIKAHREYESETNRYFSADEMNAIRKLEEYRQNYFAWVYDFTLPTTNNISESGLRMTKTKQKVSGQFLKEETAAEFAAVRTYTETCRKNGVNEYEALKRLMQENPYTVKEILTGMT